MNNPITIIPIDKKEIKDMSINYFFYETDYGLALVASTSRGICYLGFGDKESMITAMKKEYPHANFTEKEDEFHQQALKFIRNEEVSELPLHISGTDFQLRVWQELVQIPLGKLSSYQAVANAINNPKAVRAVGSAIGDNPVSYIIPCHRVIRTDGGLGGYFWGLDIKKRMLEKEGAKVRN